MSMLRVLVVWMPGRALALQWVGSRPKPLMCQMGARRNSVTTQPLQAVRRMCSRTIISFRERATTWHNHRNDRLKVMSTSLEFASVPRRIASSENTMLAPIAKLALEVNTVIGLLTTLLQVDEKGE